MASRADAFKVAVSQRIRRFGSCSAIVMIRSAPPFNTDSCCPNIEGGARGPVQPAASTTEVRSLSMAIENCSFLATEIAHFLGGGPPRV